MIKSLRVLAALTTLATTLTLTPTPAAAQAGSIHHYRYPTPTLTALHDCITTHGGIPGPTGAWENITPAQLDTCQHATVWATGVWNWADRIPGVDR